MSNGMILKWQETMEGVYTESSGGEGERVSWFCVFSIFSFGSITGEAAEFDVSRGVGEEE
jgi:hypothetical protein